jgi:hypothetical protein
MARPKVYPDIETYRREYNSRPEVKERNRIHNIKWKSKPEVKVRLREYNREYMKTYWVTHPEKYKKQKLRIAELNRARIQQRRKFQNVV